MSALQIENPTETIFYQISWTQLIEHILKVVATFPREYRVINNDVSNNKIVILNIPISPEGKSITKDQIIYINKISLGDTQATAKFEITNEDNKIASYTELDRDKKSLNIFKILLQKSIDGTLKKTVSNVNAKAKQVGSGQGIMQIIILIVALAAIFYALKVLMM